MALFPIKSLQFVRGSAEGILILTGIGYGPSGMASMARVARSHPDFDFFIPNYIQKSSIGASADFLLQYRKQWKLDDYELLHVVCFIAGGYVLARVIEDNPWKNIGSVILDRSPYQERAPSIVTRKMPIVARLLLGSFVFDLASRSYPDYGAILAPAGLKPGLLIEEKPTMLMRFFSWECKKMGPLSWEPEAMASAFLDWYRVPYNHDSIYSNFHKLAPLVFQMIRK